MQEMNFILSCYMLTLILIDSSYLHDVFTSLCPVLSLLLQLHVPKPKTTIPDPKKKKKPKQTDEGIHWRLLIG